MTQLPKNNSNNNKDENIEKINYYMSKCDRSLPILNDPQNVGQQLRSYFDDQQLTIGYQETSVLHEEYFHDKMTEIYKNFVQETQSMKQKCFVDFVQFWILRDDKLNIQYQPYDDSLKEAAKSISTQFVRQIINGVSQKVYQYQIGEQYRGKLKTGEIESSQGSPILYHQQSKIHVETRKKQLRTPQQLLKSHIQIVHAHYSRKLVGLPKTNSFQQLQHVYNTISLNQWMCFAKEVGILYYKCEKPTIQLQQSRVGVSSSQQTQPPIVQEKSQQDFQQGKTNQFLPKNDSNDSFAQENLDKKIKQSKQVNSNHKSVPNSSIYEKLGLNFYKKVFQKHSKEFVLDLPTFQKTLDFVLKYMLNKQSLTENDYAFLGLTDETSFRKLASKVGIYLPRFEVMFRTPSVTKNYHLKVSVNGLSIRPKLPTVHKSIQTSSIPLSHSRSQVILTQKAPLELSRVKPHKKLYKSREQKEQSELLNKMSVNNLKKIRMTQEEQNELWNIIGEGYESQYGTKKELSNGSYLRKGQELGICEESGILGRIDSRISNVMKRMR